MPDTILQFLCRRVTEHRWRKLTTYSVGIEPVEYHYTCRLCRKHFWNYTVNPSELERFNHRILNRKSKKVIPRKFWTWRSKRRARDERNGNDLS